MDEGQTQGCEQGVHQYPDQDFEIGARVCELCGHKEY